MLTNVFNPDSDLIYTLEHNSKMNYNRNILNARFPIEQKIKNFFLTDKVYYQDNDVGDTINNYLKECKRGII